MNRSKFGPWLAPFLLLVAFPASAANYTVAVGPGGDFLFDPPSLAINVGDSVTWVSDGGGLHAHNVVATGLFRCAAGCDGEGGNGNASAAPWTVTRTFTDAGTVNYFCEVHKNAGMNGRITVGASSAAFAIGPGLTGAWYDPQQSGHGLFLEVLPGNRLLAWWFTFTPDGAQQSWFGGVGTYSGNNATVAADLTTGGRWIPNFDHARIVGNPWGTLTFSFTDCNTGRVDFMSTYPGYGSNHMDLTRLTLPAGLTCP